MTAASLIAETRALGLSLGDRACLALGLALSAPVYDGNLEYLTQVTNFLNEHQGEPVKATRWPQERNKGVLPRCCRGGAGPLRVSVDLRGDHQADNLPSLWCR